MKPDLDEMHGMARCLHGEGVGSWTNKDYGDALESARTALAAKDARIAGLEAAVEAARRLVQKAPVTSEEDLHTGYVSVEWTNNARDIEDLRAALAGLEVKP